MTDMLQNIEEIGPKQTFKHCKDKPDTVESEGSQENPRVCNILQTAAIYKREEQDTQSKDQSNDFVFLDHSLLLRENMNSSHSLYQNESHRYSRSFRYKSVVKHTQPRSADECI